MKPFIGLRIVATLARLLAVLTALISALGALGTDGLQASVFLLLGGLVAGLLLYTSGEVISLILDWHTQQTLSTEAQIRLYQLLKTRPEIQPLKHARRQ